MKLRLDFSIFDFSYTFPIQVKNHYILENQILSVDIYLNDFHIKKIDFTNLFNFHNYTLIEWKKTLENFFIDEDFFLDEIILEKPFFNMIKTSKVIKGELLFIIESVLFSIIEKKSPETLAHIKKSPIKLNALYNPSSHYDILKNIPECIKIKIRPTKSNFNSTFEIINSLLAVKSDILFRFDGNQTFEVFELLDFLSNVNIPLKNIMYLEEPLKNFNELSAFEKNNSISYALDESVLAFIENIYKLPKNHPIILKPSLIGISKCFEILKNRKKNIIISSTYETISAMNPMIYLAAALPDSYHGLDTFKFLPKHLSTDTLNYSLSF